MKRARFPIEIKNGSTTVKIYRHTRKSGQIVYTVAWYSGGQRKIRQFSTLAKAKDEARLKSDQLNAGKISVASNLTVDDVELLRAVRSICGDTPVLSALEQYAKAIDLVGDDLMEACRSWAAKNAGGVKKIDFPDAVDRFYNAKLRAGIKAEGYKKMLPRMKKHFEKRPIAAITARELDSMIHREFSTEGKEMAHPASYNSARKKLVSMFRWCRKQGLLPAERQTEPERLDRVIEEELQPGIIRVDALARALHLIETDYTDLLGVTILAAFAGMRRSEIHAQLWADIDLERSLLRVTSGKRGTPARRLIRLCPAATLWLMKCERSEDQHRVSPTDYAFDAVRRVLREAGFDLPENCFRHGWISHRVAQTQDIAATSLEAGNSPDVVRKHYLELIGQPEGEQWFELTPDRVAKIDGKVVRYG